MHKGYIQVYTGKGKGKTTAALGLAFRAAGAGLRVFIAQFIKKKKCSEHNAMERYKDLVVFRHYGTRLIRKGKPTKSQIDSAKKGLKEIKETTTSGEFDVIILDEVNIATHYRFFSIDELLDVLNSKPQNVEIVLTGRYTDKRIIERADLVTEMKEIKHYFKKGVKAREGIEM